MAAYSIRTGTREDLPRVLELIHELAEYEKLPHEVENTVEAMEAEGFGEQPSFGFFVAEAGQVIVGIALWYYSYSTWKGKSLYLEDLIVTESHRGSGIGQALLEAIIQKGKAEKLGRLMWQVIDWNEPAINFYKKMGAELDGTWINCRLSSTQLQEYQG